MKELERYFELKKERPDQFINNGLLTIVADESEMISFMNTTHKKLGVIYESPYNTLVVDLVKNQKGDLFAYERLLKEDNSVIVIVMYKGEFLLLKQYRHALRKEQYAFVRGFGEKSLSAKENAIKEVEEEIHGKVISAEQLSTIVLDSGMCGSKTIVFLVEIESYSVPIGYEGIKEYSLVNEEEFDDMIKKGVINDSPTLSAYCLYKLNK